MSIGTRKSSGEKDIQESKKGKRKRFLSIVCNRDLDKEGIAGERGRLLEGERGINYEGRALSVLNGRGSI